MYDKMTGNYVMPMRVSLNVFPSVCLSVVEAQDKKKLNLLEHLAHVLITAEEALR